MQYKIEMPLITDLRKHVVCCYFSINFVFKCYLILCMSVIGNVYKMQNCKRNVSSTCQIVETGFNEQFCMYIQKTVHNTFINNTEYLQWLLLYHISRRWRSLLILIYPLGTNCCSCWVSVWWWQASNPSLENCTRGGCVLASCYLYWRRHLRWVCVGTVQELYIYPLKVSSN